MPFRLNHRFALESIRRAFGSRSRWLWAATILTILFWLVGRDAFNVQNDFIELLDQRWLAFKQNQQREWRRGLKPSKKVALLQLEYSSKVDFWFDDIGRARLAEALAVYQGPILWNIDPLLMMKDRYLAPLLEHKNIVRPIRMEYGGFSRTSSGYLSDDFEVLASRRVEQDPSVNLTAEDCVRLRDVSRCIKDLVTVLPLSAAYYSQDALWGFTGLGRSKIGLSYEGHGNTQLISELPLRLPAAKMELPNLLLGGIVLGQGCRDYSLSRSTELVLSGCASSETTKLFLQDPLPLFFYKYSYGKWPYWQSDLEHLPKDKVLIVDLIDSASVYENLLGEKYTWGALMATALSNTFENHTPKKSSAIRWFERFISVLALGVILFLYRRENLRWYLEVLVGLLVCVALVDFSMTFFFNYLTKPVGEFLSLSLAGFVGLGILSWREAERRSLIERALSGYVSPQRLQSLISGDEKLSLAGQRKELTTLQLDLRGFSLITKEMEVEEVFPFVKELFSAIDPIIFNHRGVIDKKLGDGLMAFFGDSAGQSPEQAAHAAVRAAMEIQNKLSSLSEELFESASRISARIGVNTGPMMIGNSGSEKHFNYTVLGEAVNFTARLEAACPSGSVLVGEETAKYVRSAWKLVPTQIQVKHEEATVTAYLILEPLR